MADQLSLPERQALLDALLSAYPSEGDLEQLLYFELDKNLRQIRDGRNYGEVVGNLIQKAEGEGWLDAMISAAHRKNPGNSKLRAFVASYQTRSQPSVAPFASTATPPVAPAPAAQRLDPTLRDKFVDALLSIPVMDEYQNRSVLVADLPRGGINRNQSSAQLDLIQIINGFDSLGPLTDGRKPLIEIAKQALRFARGTAVETTLHEVIQALERYYGEDIQPTSTPLAEGEQEKLIFGRLRDTRLPFAFIEGAARTSRSIARLWVPRIFNGVPEQIINENGQPDDGHTLGTGWLIAPGLLITNHHVIEARDQQSPAQGGKGEPPADPKDFQMQGEQVVAWFDYQSGAADAPKPKECHARLVHSNQQLDYAFVRVVEAETIADRQPLPIIRQPPQLAWGARLNIAQHPRGGPLRYAIRNNFYVQPGKSADYLGYQTDTEPGSSGSPVCDDAWQVVGLHHGTTPPIPIKQVPQEVIGAPNAPAQPPLVSVSFLNEAIVIHSILKDLPQALRDEIEKAQGWKP